MSKLYNTKFKPTKVGIIKAVGQKIGSLIKGKGKVSPDIKSVKPNVPKTKSEKAKSKLAIAKQETKGSQAKLNQTIFNLQEQNRQFKKDRIKKMGGGFMGKRMGYKDGSEKGKVPTTPKEKAFGMLSVNKGLDNNKNITFTDKIAGATGGKKKKKA